jgi:D-arabinose 5-phosphate isomerase GutQ
MTTALSRCLQEEAAAIAAAAQRLDSKQVEAALSLLDTCRNHRAKLVVTGIGKSGIVARKNLCHLLLHRPHGRLPQPGGCPPRQG